MRVGRLLLLTLPSKTDTVRFRFKEGEVVVSDTVYYATVTWKPPDGGGALMTMVKDLPPLAGELLCRVDNYERGKLKMIVTDRVVEGHSDAERIRCRIELTFSNVMLPGGEEEVEDHDVEDLLESQGWRVASFAGRPVVPKEVR